MSIEFVGWEELVDRYDPSTSRNPVVRAGTNPFVVKTAELLDSALGALPHHGPTSLFAAASNLLSRVHHKRAGDYAHALRHIMWEYGGDERFKIALDFDAKKVRPWDQVPSAGVWFTQSVGNRLFLFWHPDPRLKLNRTRLIFHQGRGGDLASRIRFQTNVWARLLS